MRKNKILAALTAVLCCSLCVAWIRPNLKAPADWKLGIALWTFHRFTLAESIVKSDSAGVHYIEAASFQKMGNEIEDKSLAQISDQGIEKLDKFMDGHHMQMKSMYLFAGNSVASWKSGFELAKRLKLEFITGEPPKAMWDSIDSLAGVYHIKVAIHNHWKGMSIYWHPDSVLAAIKGHPNFGACPDLGHWPKSGIDAVYGLKKLQGHILAIHLKDADEANNPKANDVNLGKGVVNFKAAFEELKRQKYKGYIYIERDADYRPSNLPSVKEEIEYYDQITAKL